MSGIVPSALAILPREIFLLTLLIWYSWPSLAGIFTLR